VGRFFLPAIFLASLLWPPPAAKSFKKSFKIFPFFTQFAIANVGGRVYNSIIKKEMRNK